CPGCSRQIPLQPEELRIAIVCVRCNAQFIPAELLGLSTATTNTNKPAPGAKSRPANGGSFAPASPTQRDQFQARFPPNNGEMREHSPNIYWQWISGVGTAVLFLGLFSPVVQGPLGYSRNYFNQPWPEAEVLSLPNGILVILLLVIAVSGVIGKRPR